MSVDLHNLSDSAGDFYPKSAPQEFKDEIVTLEASVAQAGQADSLLIPQLHNLINLFTGPKVKPVIIICPYTLIRTQSFKNN